MGSTASDAGDRRPGQDLPGASRTADDSRFAGSVPELYDRLMVPMIFAEAAERLAGIVAARTPDEVLETAAGTGVLTDALRRACPRAAIVATDLNQPMLDRAADRVGGDRRVRFRAADALDLPFDDSTFDVVACQFGAMFFPDRVRGYRESRRVLRAGGALILNVWDSLENNDFARIVSAAVNELCDDARPLDFFDRVPHGYFDPEQIRGDLQRAGLEVVSLEAVDAVSVATALDAATALCQGTPWRTEIEQHPQVALEAATLAAQVALRRHYGDGSIEGRIRSFEVVAERGA